MNLGMAAAVVVVVAMIIILMFFRWYMVSYDYSNVALTANLLISFVGFVNYSSVILDAYEFSRAVGHRAAFSGMVIGIFMWGTAAGFSFCWLAMKYWPEVWRNQTKSMLQMGLACQIVGAIV